MNTQLDYSMSNNYQASSRMEDITDQQETGIAELEKEYRNDPDIVAESLGDFSNDEQAKKLLMRLQHAKDYHKTELALMIADLLVEHINEYIAFIAQRDYFKGNTP